MAYLYGAIGAIIAASIAAVGAIFAAKTASKISYSNKIADFRQNWINELRVDIADYLAASELWMRKWDELNSLGDRSQIAERERNESLPLSVSARTVLNRINLRINPRQSPDLQTDMQLLETLGQLLNPGAMDPRNAFSSWRRQSDEAVAQARELLKREWEKTKNVIGPN